MFKGYLQKKTIIDIAVLFMCLGIVMLLAKLYHPNNLAMHKVSPHPFFIISIVYSAYHGLRFSILSSIATAILYYALLAYQTDFQEVESIFTGAYLVLPLTTAIVSIVIGDIRQRTWTRQQEKQKELNDAHDYVELLKKEKENLDLKFKEISSRLVSKLETTRSMYHKAQGFYQFDNNELLKSFIQALKDDCSVDEAEVFLVNQPGSNFALWEVEEGVSELARSSYNISLDQRNILQEIVASERVFTVRDQLLDQGLRNSGFPCLIAAPIKKGEAVHAVVMITKMPFLKLTPTNLIIVEMICDWFGQALEYSDQFNSLMRDSLINREDLTYRPEFFERHFADSSRFARKNGLQITGLGVSWTTAGFRASELGAFKGLLIKTLEFLCNELEVVGEGVTNDSLSVLLYRDQKQAEEFLSLLRGELANIRTQSGLERFPELIFNIIPESTQSGENLI